MFHKLFYFFVFRSIHCSIWVAKYIPIANPTMNPIAIVVISIIYLLKYNVTHATNKHAHKYNTNTFIF
jgi:hypothetical protein